KVTETLYTNFRPYFFFKPSFPNPQNHQLTLPTPQSTFHSDSHFHLHTNRPFLGNFAYRPSSTHTPFAQQDHTHDPANITPLDFQTYELRCLTVIGLLSNIVWFIATTRRISRRRCRGLFSC